MPNYEHVGQATMLGMAMRRAVRVALCKYNRYGNHVGN
jgi:hypothetical protein